MADIIVNHIFNSITYILPVGELNYCYLVDCGDVENVIEHGWCVRGVLLTHCHCDHIYGLNKLLEVFPKAVIYTNDDGRDGLQNPKWNFSRYHEDLSDFRLEHPENVRVIDKECILELECALTAEAFFVPGHDPSCIAYRIGDSLYTGDAYIPGVQPVTSFPRSDKNLACESLSRLQAMEKSGLIVRPGHWIDYSNHER